MLTAELIELGQQTSASVPIALAAEEYSEPTNDSAAIATTDLNIDRTQWPIEIQNALDGTYYFDKIRYKAIYWYLIEMIAQRLKTGELRNPKIYEFNPDVVYNQAQPTINQQLQKHPWF